MRRKHFVSKPAWTLASVRKANYRASVQTVGDGGVTKVARSFHGLPEAVGEFRDYHETHLPTFLLRIAGRAGRFGNDP